MEDPSLDRALSPTGFTTPEELQAQQIDSTNALLHAFLLANFEEPKGGWPKLMTVPRPGDRRPKAVEEEPKEKPKLASAADIVQFTEENRDE